MFIIAPFRFTNEVTVTKASKQTVLTVFVEYSFGGHDMTSSGIFAVPEKTELPGTRFRLVHIVFVPF